MEDANSCGTTDAPPMSVRTPNGPCTKCDAPRSYSVSRSRRLCKECYTQASASEFRRSLHRVRLFRKGERTRLLLAYSGGPSSSAMVAFLEPLLGADSRAVSYDVRVVWVDCLHVLPLVDSHEAARIRARVAALSGVFSCITIPLHHFFMRQTGLDEAQAREQLERCFSVPAEKLQRQQHHPLDVTWKEELCDHMIRTLLVRHAQENGIHRIVTGETLTRACVKLVAGISRGVGSNAPAQLSDCDAFSMAEENVIWARPLISLTASEVALSYRALRGHSVPAIPSFAHPLVQSNQQRNSARSLAEAFLLRLETNHSHSLHKLAGTVHKLGGVPALAPEWFHCWGCPKEERVAEAVKAEPFPARERCSLCLVVVKPRSGVDGCDSNASAGGGGGGGGCDGGGCEGGACGSKSSSYVCRSCELVLQELERSNGTTLGQIAPRPSAREQQRALIADCLLSDADEDD